MTMNNKESKPLKNNVFSFRAELLKDALTFQQQAYVEKKYIEFYTIQAFSPDGDMISPDVMVEIRTQATLEELRSVLHNVPDCHVMIESLRQLPMSENSMERDRTVPWSKEG